MTDPEIQRPGLCVAAAAETLDLDDDDIVVVVQGDEPLVPSDMSDLAAKPLLTEQDVFVSNLMTELTDFDWKDPGEIKVVCDLESNAMYMSRGPIPSIDHEESRTNWFKRGDPRKARSTIPKGAIARLISHKD